MATSRGGVPTAERKGDGMGEDSLRLKLLRHLPSIQEGYPLGKFSPLGAGGTADFFTEVADTVELASAVKAAIDLKLPYHILGQGTGTIFSDGGFPGLVIHNQTTSFAVAQEKSQVVVDSGLPLSRLVLQAAGNGLGGLIPFSSAPGTVGGALYAGESAEGFSLISSVRYLTMLMPPARLDREATINRYRREWLEGKDGGSRLLAASEQSAFEQPKPVILAVLFQLTTVRPDELRIRLQQEAADPHFPTAHARALGPIFNPVPGYSVVDLLKKTGAGALRVGNLIPDRRTPSYLVARKGLVSASDIRTLVELMAQRVEEKTGIHLQGRYEYIGVW